jgi:hypothetical protein
MMYAKEVLFMAPKVYHLVNSELQWTHRPWVQLSNGEREHWYEKAKELMS